ncbi:MAG: DUF1697 domain-containing protein [Bryobacteraceae bacterium]|jgi:uncharacterized protein (DUF1697 family)
MPVYIALLRGVNLLSHNRIKMDVLRSVCESIKLRDVQTYIQSGNIVFRTKETNTAKLTARIERAIEAEFGCRPAVILRTTSQWKDAIARNPFASRSGIEPNKLLVHFLAGDPGDEAREKVRAIPPAAEELHIFERELYIHFPNGMARPKLSMPAIERALKVTGSGRNWNSVMKLLEMAERLESAR